MFTNSLLRKTTCAPSPFPVSPPAFMDILRWPLHWLPLIFFFSFFASVNCWSSSSSSSSHHHHQHHHPGICLRGGSAHCEEVFGEAQGLCGQGRRESRYWLWWTLITIAIRYMQLSLWPGQYANSASPTLLDKFLVPFNTIWPKWCLAGDLLPLPERGRGVVQREDAHHLPNNQSWERFEQLESNHRQNH